MMHRSMSIDKLVLAVGVCAFLCLHRIIPSAFAFLPPQSSYALRRSILDNGIVRVPHAPLSFVREVTFWSRASNNRIMIIPKSIGIQRKSVASVQTQLFGLGFGEIAVILLVLGAVLGPENIGRIAKTSSSRAQEISEELKRVPDEFQKGMEEGETEARARNAKRIKIVREETKQDCENEE